MTRPGRPSKGRTQLLTIRMSPAELAAAHRLASEAGASSTAEYVRRLLEVRAVALSMGRAP